MSGESYPIGTLFEMAAIPEEALPRFLAELPSILADVRAILKIQGSFNELADGYLAMSTRAPAWVDDDLQSANLRIHGPDGEVLVDDRRALGAFGKPRPA